MLIKTAVTSRLTFLTNPRVASVTKPYKCVLQRFAVALLQLSVAAALIATVSLKPYTVDAPKKILLQHLHVQVRISVDVRPRVRLRLTLGFRVEVRRIDWSQGNG